MDSKVAQKRKKDNHSSNINYVNSDDYQRGMKINWNKKLFPPLNFINGKILTYARKIILRHSRYWSDQELYPSTVAIRRITCSGGQ